MLLRFPHQQQRVSCSRDNSTSSVHTYQEDNNGTLKSVDKHSREGKEVCGNRKRLKDRETEVGRSQTWRLYYVYKDDTVALRLVSGNDLE